MLIRTEVQSDWNEVFDVNYLAFGNRDDEAKLVEQIRGSKEFIPELSLVAEMDHQIVGHLMLSKAKVINPINETDVIVLAPIAIRPEFQKQGIGSQLINEGIRRTRELGYGLIFLIGHPSYYPRLGFRPARSYGFELNQYKVSDPVFMVYEVLEGQLDKLQGELIYPESFSSI